MIDIKKCWDTEEKNIKGKNWFLIDDEYDNYKLEYMQISSIIV